MSEDDILDIVNLIFESIRMVQERFSKIGVSEDFVSTPNGVTLLDAISIVRRISRSSAG